MDDNPTMLLIKAIKSNNFAKVERLLYIVADVNTKYEKNMTALFFATDENRKDSHYDVIKVLLENGADVNVRNEEHETTPLHLLVKKTNPKTVKLMIDFKADVEAMNKYGQTPLFYAVQGGLHTLEVVKVLVEHGSSVNHACLDSSTPLHWACRGISNDILRTTKYLLNEGANIEARDNFDCTPFLWFLTYYCNETRLPIMKFLLKYAHFNVDPVLNNIQHAHSYRQKEAYWKMLLEHNAKLQAVDVTSLHPSFSHKVLTTTKFNQYFQECTKELVIAKSTKLKNSWVSFFNLLVDSKRKLKNYAGNDSLIEDFKNSDCLKKFPIYGAEIIRKVEKGIERRKLFDKISVKLSNILPMFNPTHLVIRDILDCLTNKDFIVFDTKS